MNYNSLHEGTDVIRGGDGRKLQSHVISAMGLVQSPIRTLHQPPLGIINHLGRKASMSEKNLRSAFGTFHWSFQVAFSLSQLWQSFNHGKSFIMTFKDEIFMPHAMGWRVPRFLNIQICARCRDPNMKYLCLRVTQSRADEIFRSLPRVTQISSHRRQNFCRPRFYGGI